ncbi:MAG: hemin-degrading factor [Bacteroidetes bacterium]|nr:hemin-degrading factor [Bacteroidota bacterium]
MQKQLTVKEQAKNLLKSEPRLRTRDLAARLGLSEAEYLSHYTDQHITLLEGDWKALLQSMEKMGYVMALTRNEHCVHERKGIYKNVEFYDGPHNMGVAVNPDIDLRFFMNAWKYALAITMERGSLPTLYGFQFFNAEGEAVHKIYSTPKSDLDAYRQLVGQYKAKVQEPWQIESVSTPEKSKEIPDSNIDKDSFQHAWENLEDTHDFFGLLKKFKVSRTQGLRLAPNGFTQQVDNQSVVKMLNTVAEREVPIMCFVHSKGCVQIHTGTVTNLKEYGEWYNVMDPEFNLHLFMPAVAESWIVKKPTKDGIVTSLELFDKNGELIVYFFGKRKPGIPELKSWREVVASI